MAANLCQDQIKAAIDQAIAARKSQILSLCGGVDAMADDNTVRKVAALLHPFLPLPIRFVIKKDTLANILIDRRDDITALLRR